MNYSISKYVTVAALAGLCAGFASAEEIAGIIFCWGDATQQFVSRREAEDSDLVLGVDMAAMERHK